MDNLPQRLEGAANGRAATRWDTFSVIVSAKKNEKGFYVAQGTYIGEQIICFARNQKRAMAFVLDEVSKRLKIMAEHDAREDSDEGKEQGELKPIGGRSHQS